MNNRHWQIPYQVRNDWLGLHEIHRLRLWMTVRECMRFFAYGSEWLFGSVWDSSPVGSEWQFGFVWDSSPTALNDCSGVYEIYRLRLWMTVRVCMRFFACRLWMTVRVCMRFIACRLWMTVQVCMRFIAYGSEWQFGSVWDLSPAALNDMYRNDRVCDDC